MRGAKAKEIYDFVVNILASGEWPVSRTKLEGYRLKQISDAIKIVAGQMYYEEIKGICPLGRWKNLKEKMSAFMEFLPSAFIRNEDWERIQLIKDEKTRKTELMVAGSSYLSKDNQDDEVKELMDDETFTSFCTYLENLPNEYSGFMDHVLGHLSRRYIYTDDIIPVFETNPFEKHKHKQS